MASSASSDSKYETEVEQSSDHDDLDSSEETDAVSMQGKGRLPKNKQGQKTRPKQQKRSGRGKKSYPHVLELPDGEGENFYAYDDPQMASWLGSRDTFIDVLRFASPGLVEKHRVGDKRNLRLYKCTMMHVRRKAVCLYTEPEYERLAIEAHVASKPKNAAVLSGNRTAFVCVHCKFQAKDKNRLSWHRMTAECKGYRGTAFLKMYPMWSRSDTTELQRIMANQGRAVSEAEPPPTAKRRSEDVNKGRNRKKPKVGADSGADAERAQKVAPPARTPATTQESNRAPVLLENEDDIRITSITDAKKPLAQTPRSGPATRSGSQIQKTRHATQDKGELWKVKTRPREEEGGADGGPLETVHDTKKLSLTEVETPSHSMKVADCPQSRIAVECAANVKVAAFTLEIDAGLRPKPEEVKWTGAGLLIYDSGLVIDRQTLQDPDAAAARLLEMHHGGSLVSKLYSVFGQWFFKKTAEELHPVNKIDVFAAVECSLKSLSAGEEGNGAEKVSVAVELQKIHEYLRYRVDYDQYMLERAQAIKTLTEMRTKYVSDQLHSFDMKTTLDEEHKRWNWSPLYNMLKTDPPSGWPAPPWSHTTEELDRLLLEWAAQEPSGQLSLERDCPHLVRALKLLTRQVHGTAEPIAHPLTGLCKERLYSIGKAKNLSGRLTRLVQDLIAHGGLFFPTLYSASEPLDECRTDLLALLGYGSGQKQVVDKVSTFLNRIARRSVLDMVHTGHQHHLDAMWQNVSFNEDQQNSCQTVFEDALFLRENIDLGWAFVGERTTARPFPVDEVVEHAAMKAILDLRCSQLRAVQALWCTSSLHGDSVLHHSSPDRSAELNKAPAGSNAPANSEAMAALTMPNTFLNGLDDYCSQNVILRSQRPPLRDARQLSREEDLCEFHLFTMPDIHPDIDGPGFSRTGTEKTKPASPAVPDLVSSRCQLQGRSTSMSSTPIRRAEGDVLSWSKASCLPEADGNAGATDSPHLTLTAQGDHLLEADKEDGGQSHLDRVVETTVQFFLSASTMLPSNCRIPSKALPPFKALAHSP